MSQSTAPIWTTEQLYDLFMLGLSWACDENDPKAITQSGLAVFHALHQARVIGEAQRKKAVTNLELIDRFRCYADHDNEGKPKPLEQVRVILSASEQLVVVFMPRATALNHTKYFGPEGYPLGVAPAGRTYAESIAPAYEEFIGPESFGAGWQRYTSWLRGVPCVDEMIR